MTTYVVDTNTLLDAFLSRRQSTEIRDILAQAENHTCTLWIPLVVFFELSWVLASFYKKDKKYIVNLLNSLLRLDGVMSENRPDIEKAIATYESHSAINFSDAYIVAVAVSRTPQKFLTNDKKLLRLYDQMIKKRPT